MSSLDINTIITRTANILTNYSNLAREYFNIFYNPDPLDIVIQMYDDNNVLQTYTIPNRAKDFNYIKNGNGSPENTVSGSIGTIYQDKTNGNLYIKTLGTTNTGWKVIVDKSVLDTFILKGEGSPEGQYTAPKGTLYVDVQNNILYSKTTSSSNIGWEVLLDPSKLPLTGGTLSGSLFINVDSDTYGLQVGTTKGFLGIGTEHIKDNGTNLVIEGSKKVIYTNNVIVPYGTQYNEAVNLEQLKKEVSAGMISYFATMHPPEGWLVADGSWLNRITYANLYQNIKLSNSYPFYVNNVTSKTILIPNWSPPSGESITVYLSDDIDQIGSSFLPDGLAEETVYYLRTVATNIYTLHLTYTDAINNINIVNITSRGSGDHRIAQSGIFNIPELRGLYIRGMNTITQSTAYYNVPLYRTGSVDAGSNVVTITEGIGGAIVGRSIVMGAVLPANTIISAILSPTTVQISNNASGAYSGRIHLYSFTTNTYIGDAIISHTHGYYRTNGGATRGGGGHDSSFPPYYSETSYVGEHETRTRSKGFLPCIKY